MAAVYTITVNEMFVHTQGDLTGVVKEVKATMTGTDSGCEFALPFTVIMPPAQAGDFTPYQDLTQDQVVAWIWSQTDQVEPVQAHVQLVLTGMVAQAQLTEEPLPWAPPTPPTPPTPTP